MKNVVFLIGGGAALAATRILGALLLDTALVNINTRDTLTGGDSVPVHFTGNTLDDAIAKRLGPGRGRH